MSDESKKSPALEAFDYVMHHYRLAQSQDGVPIAIPEEAHSGARVAVEIGAMQGRILRELRAQGLMLSREAAGTVMAALASEAEIRPVEHVALRVADRKPAIFLDLANADGHVVSVTSWGWQVMSKSAGFDPGLGPLFRRTRATKALPIPERGGTRDELRELLGLEEGDPRWLLLWGWLVASLFESVPRPILWALGPQGSGKSTRARMVLSVVDPAEALGREPGKNERDDTTATSGRFIPSWDNIGSVSAATSDWLCRIVTGVEIGRRALYSDDDLRVLTLRRTAVATSIVLPYGLGADALERLVLVEFERVPESDRRAESELWQQFREAHPRILGALLDDVAGVLEHIQEVRRTTSELPRMADYAQILYALDEHVDPWADTCEFARAYMESVSTVLADRAQADPLTAALLAHVEREGGDWRGQADALLRSIERDRPDDPRARWPRSAASLSDAVRRGAETLRAAGLVVEFGRTGRARWVRLVTTPVTTFAGSSPETAGSSPPSSPVTPQVGAEMGLDGDEGDAVCGVTTRPSVSKSRENRAPDAPPAMFPQTPSPSSPSSSALALLEGPSLADVLDDGPPTAAQREARRAWDRGEHL